MLILIVAGGPDKGRIYELREDQAVILGREGDQIRLNDRKCSRKHAKIWAEGGKWYVRDLNSRHGTHVNATQVENRHELADGDHIQLGSTLFVLARTTADHLERMALLGDGPTASHVDTAPLAKLVRPRVLVGGAAAAAALLIGSNAFFYFASKQQVDRLYTQLERTQTQAASQPDETQQTLREILAGVQAQREQEKLLTQIAESLKQQPEQATMLREVLAKLDGTSQPAAETRAMLETLLARTEAQPQAQAKTQEMLAAVLERVETKPSVDLEPLVAEVRAVADAARQQQQALAARATEQDALLRDSLAQLKAPATPNPDFAASLEKAMASNAGNTELLKQILANLDQQKTLATEVGALRELVEHQPQATQAVLREIVRSLPTNDDSAVLAAIDEMKRSVPQDVSEKLDAMLARLDGPATSPEDVATALKAALDERQAAADEALERLSAKLDAQPTRDDLRRAVDTAAAKPVEQVMAKLDDLAKAQPTAESLLAALDAAQREPDPQLLARLDAIATQLEASQAAAAQDGGDELATELAAATRETRQLLGDVLAEVRNREPLDGLRAEVARLAEAQATAPADAASTAAAEAKLAEMHELIRAWPEQTESMLKEMVTAIADANDPEAEAIQGVLTDIKQRAMARIDELDSAIRNDIRAGLAQELEAAAAATPPSRGRATRSAVLASPMVESVTTATGLSKTEEAYKMAFETGQPIRIGAGVVNARTGEVSEGRTLDPVAAKAAGMKTWHEWYTYDEFAERMRLQKQALRYTGDGTRNDVITLPSNTATKPQVVEQATPAAAPGADQEGG